MAGEAKKRAQLEGIPASLYFLSWKNCSGRDFLPSAAKNGRLSLFWNKLKDLHHSFADNISGIIISCKVNAEDI